MQWARSLSQISWLSAHGLCPAFTSERKPWKSQNFKPAPNTLKNQTHFTHQWACFLSLKITKILNLQGIPRNFPRNQPRFPNEPFKNALKTTCCIWWKVLDTHLIYLLYLVERFNYALIYLLYLMQWARSLSQISWLSAHGLCPAFTSERKPWKSQNFKPAPNTLKNH